MNILCALFGHRPETCGSQGRIQAPYHDGVGSAHRDVYAYCTRCEKNFYVISVIDPLLAEVKEHKP